MALEYRWERREKLGLGYFERCVSCPPGEGYGMSGYKVTHLWPLITSASAALKETMMELEVVKREDYDRVARTSISEETTE